MPTSINSNLTACLNSFDQLKARMEQPDYRHETEVPLGSWIDESYRLRVWALNVGAYQTGQSSFDSRLGDAPGIRRKIKQQITKWLEDLDEALTDTLGELSETAPSASGDDTQSDPSSKQMIQLQQSHDLVVNIIKCLNQLSTLIPKPTRAIVDSESEGSSVEDDENPGTSPAREPGSPSTNSLGSPADHGQNRPVALENMGHDGHSGNVDHGDAYHAGR